VLCGQSPFTVDVIVTITTVKHKAAATPAAYKRIAPRHNAEVCLGCLKN
jgi:hypothetical protein